MRSSPEEQGMCCDSDSDHGSLSMKIISKIEVITGVKQGDGLSPLLFNLAIENCPSK
jgi:hypothetical protein